MFASEKSNSEQHFGSWMWRPDNWSEYVMTSFFSGLCSTQQNAERAWFQFRVRFRTVMLYELHIHGILIRITNSRLNKKA